MTATSENALSPPRSGPPDALDPQDVESVVAAALREDVAGGDVTSESVLAPDLMARARLIAKAEGVIAGLDVFARVFQHVDPDTRIELLAKDGDRVAPGAQLASVSGAARALLAAERTALNFVQRMSGTATLTARLVALTAGRARVLDTRKTTPGLRVLEKYAVRCGGGENHRFGLFDEVMIKDNHLDLAAEPLAELVARARRRVGARVRITVEARGEAEALEAVRSGADVVLLDNFTPAELERLVPTLRAAIGQAARPVELEASGGVDERTLAAIAAAGVDRISVGAVTHSAPALDLSLIVEAAE